MAVLPKREREAMRDARDIAKRTRDLITHRSASPRPPATQRAGAGTAGDVGDHGPASGAGSDCLAAAARRTEPTPLDLDRGPGRLGPPGHHLARAVALVNADQSAGRVLALPVHDPLEERMKAGPRWGESELVFTAEDGAPLYPYTLTALM